VTSTVSDLLPGDLVTQGPQSAVYVADVPHPHYPSLQLVIWRLDDGTWSLDALRAAQEVGDVSPATRQERWNRLQEAFR
jgi:hypothetical protein